MSDLQQSRRNSLRSWKEIAGFFQVSVRTVQRWEKKLELPVHRDIGGQPVVYLDEIEIWRKKQKEGSQRSKPTTEKSENEKLLKSRKLGLFVLVFLAVLVVSSLLWFKSSWYQTSNGTNPQIADETSEWWEDPDLPAFRNANQWLWNSSEFTKVLIEDLDQDGSPEILVNYFPSRDNPGHGKLQCFNQDQSLIWEFVYGRALKFRDRNFDEYYSGHFVRLVRDGEKVYILTVAVHHRWFPCQVALLDPTNGKLIEEYWHPGGISHCLVKDLDGDGSDEVLFSGINNPGTGLGHAFLAILKVPFSRTESKLDSEFSRFTGGREFRYILFPRTDASWVLGTLLQVYSLQIEAENKISLQISLSDSKLNSGILFYQLDTSLNVTDFRVSDDVLSTHDRLYLQGFLDHRFSNHEQDCLSRVQHFSTAPDGNSPEAARYWEDCEFPQE